MGPEKAIIQCHLRLKENGPKLRQHSSSSRQTAMEKFYGSGSKRLCTPRLKGIPGPSVNTTPSAKTAADILAFTSSLSESPCPRQPIDARGNIEANEEDDPPSPRAMNFLGYVARGDKIETVTQSFAFAVF
ncbi:unnamed protein product [Allacma fusca]|uniref:Uncharacterized protein n=1 Tax=Allacma fusca TaxID=39272 RepID=A0A8J2NZG5_9HEXA|nr:unnamed protein product [Allacma fusca]